jgi:hypothetical protein
VPEQARRFAQLSKPIGDVDGCIRDSRLVRSSHQHVHQANVRWIGRRPSNVELSRGKPLEIVNRCGREGVVIRRTGLHEHPPARLSSTGPASHLGNQLERPLRSPKIGKMKPDIGVDDANYGDAGEVEPLGDHLGTEEQIDLSPSHRLENAPV